MYIFFFKTISQSKDKKMHVYNVFNVFVPNAFDGYVEIRVGTMYV